MTYDADLGAYVSPVAVFANINNPLQSLTGCYAIPAAHAVFRMMHSNAVPTGPYRGAGRPEMALLIERLVDLAARRLALDGFELRDRNIIPVGSFPWTLPSGARYDSGDFARSDADGARGFRLGWLRGAASRVRPAGGLAGAWRCSSRFRAAAQRLTRPP